MDIEIEGRVYELVEDPGDKYIAPGGVARARWILSEFVYVISVVITTYSRGYHSGIHGSARRKSLADYTTRRLQRRRTGRRGPDWCSTIARALGCLELARAQ